MPVGRMQLSGKGSLGLLGVARRSCFVTVCKIGESKGSKQQPRSGSRTQRLRNNNTGTRYGGSYGDEAAGSTGGQPNILLEVDCG